jgi:hypothetical protein
LASQASFEWDLDSVDEKSGPGFDVRQMSPGRPVGRRVSARVKGTYC